jgi:hypothetical protein
MMLNLPKVQHLHDGVVAGVVTIVTMMTETGHMTMTMTMTVMVLLHGDIQDGVGVGGGVTMVLQVHLALLMSVVCLLTVMRTTVRKRILMQTKM